MNQNQVEEIYEMVLDLIEAIDPEAINDHKISKQSTAIYHALFRAAGIPRPDQPTPASLVDKEPASRVRRLEEAR